MLCAGFGTMDISPDEEFRCLMSSDFLGTLVLPTLPFAVALSRIATTMRTAIKRRPFELWNSGWMYLLSAFDPNEPTSRGRRVGGFLLDAVERILPSVPLSTSFPRAG